MRLHKSHITIAFLCVGFAGGLRAQYHTQMGLGNYGAVHSYYLNPSNNSFSPYNWQINLAGVWANANNNFLTLRLPYSVYRMPNRVPEAYQTASGNPSFNKSWLSENINGRPKFASISADVYGPSAFVKLKNKWSVGLITNASASVRVHKLPENLAHAIYNEFDSAQGAYSLFNQNGNNTIGPFSSTGNSRASVGINIAKGFKLDHSRQISGGITIKKVWGGPGYYMHTSGLSSQQIGQDSLLISPTNITMITYGEKLGKGWGTDIGVTYVFHKKETKRQKDYKKYHTDYYAKLGASIMDIGSIKYSDAEFRTVDVAQSTGISVRGNYSGSTDYTQALDSFMNQFGTFSNTSGTARVGLPTRVVFSGDMQLRKHVFVAGVINQSLRARNSIHNRYQSYVMVSPRIEYKFFEFSMPAVLEYDYRSLRVGASFRFGPLYIGTNSLASFLYTRHVNDADIFAGIVISDLSDFSLFKFKGKTGNNKGKGGVKCFEF